MYHKSSVLLCSILIVNGCGIFGSSNTSSAVDTKRDVEVLEAITARLTELESKLADGEDISQDLDNLRLAVQSHADAQWAEEIAGRIDILASGISAVPHWGGKIIGSLMMIGVAMWLGGKKRKRI